MKFLLFSIIPQYVPHSFYEHARLLDPLPLPQGVFIRPSYNTYSMAIKLLAAEYGMTIEFFTTCLAS